MTANLKQLAELTQTLPELDELETPIGGPVVAFNRAGQTGLLVGFGFGVYRDKEVAIMRGYMPKGCVLSAHSHHASHEWIGVIRGKLQVDFLDDNTSQVVGAFDTVYIKPNRPHVTTALEDTWRWSVSVPPAAGYPDVSGCPFAAKEPLYDRSHQPA